MKRFNFENFKWKWQDTFSMIIGLLALGYALINYSRLSPLLPIQFGITGEVNTYWSKGSVVLVFGSLGILWPVLLQFTRNIDPQRENYKKFENAHAMIRLAIALVLDTFFVMSVTYGLNKAYFSYKLLLIVLGLLFIVIGNFMPQIQHNYFIGIRTPWTLASPEIWRKTHRFSGILWAAAGLFFILGAFLPTAGATSVIISGLVLAVIPPVFYSYFASKRLKV